MDSTENQLPITGFSSMGARFGKRFEAMDWKHWAILALIFLLAFAIRGYLLRYDLMFEFDTYWHTRMTGEIIQHGVIPKLDPLAYYTIGSDVPLGTVLFWQISAFFYFIASFFTTGGFAYNKELLIAVVKFLPAFYGAIVCLGLYLLGNEAYGRRAGYLMGFLGAVSASFIYRSMAGFFEAGTLGYIFIIFGFYFVLRAVKRMENTKQAILNGAMAGILLGLLKFVYALYLIIPMILFFYLVFTLLSLWEKGQFEKALRFVQLIIGIFVLFLVVTLLGNNPHWILDNLSIILTPLQQISSFLPLVVVAVIALAGIGVYLYLRKNSEAKKTGFSQHQNTLSWVKLGLLLVILLVGMLAMLTPKTRTGITAITVGEESAGYLYFFHKFNALVVFPFLALLLIPFLDWKKKQTDWASMLFFPFILISLYIAWDRLHYSYNLGVPLAIAAAYVIYHVLSFFHKRSRSERVLGGLVIGFFILAGVASATLFTQNNTPTIELDSGWKEALYWLKDNSPQDAKMFNWWDEGHWITFLAERKVITDNRNYDRQANADVGQFVLTNDLTEASNILKKYDSDYLLLGADLFSKRNSMVLYAYYSEDVTKFNPSDPRLDPVSSFNVPCFKNESSGTVVYQCGGGTIPQEQMNSIPTVWTDRPSTIENGRNTVFYYRTKDNARVFKLSLKQNQTVFAKIWFGAPDVAPLFEEVFPDDLAQYRNKEVKIFKIHKERFPA